MKSGIVVALLFSANVFASACVINSTVMQVHEKSCIENHGMPSASFKQYCQSNQVTLSKQSYTKVKFTKSCPATNFGYCEKTLPNGNGKFRTYMYTKDSANRLKQSCLMRLGPLPAGKWVGH